MRYTHIDQLKHDIESHKDFLDDVTDNPDLHPACFRDDSFVGVDFSFNNLSYVEFCDCVFEGCDFQEADLEHATFRRCRFISGSFVETKFKDTRFCACEIFGVPLDGMSS